MSDYMLTKRVVNFRGEWMKEAKGRSYKVILTNEGQVLKQLRLKHKLSMREAGVRVRI